MFKRTLRLSGVCFSYVYYVFPMFVMFAFARIPVCFSVIRIEPLFRAFSYDVTASISVYQIKPNETAAILRCTKPILWELKAFLM